MVGQQALHYDYKGGNLAACSRMDESAERVIEIPEDIIRRILLRVPTRSLFRFRSVCKDWHRIIADPDFSVNHIRYSISALMIDFGVDKVGAYNLEEKTRKAKDLADSFHKQHKFRIDGGDYKRLQHSFLTNHEDDDKDNKDLTDDK